MTWSRFFSSRKIDRVVKIVGSDSELGNVIRGRASAGGTGGVASRLLLRKVDGIPAHHAVAVSGRPHAGAPGETNRWPSYGDASPHPERGSYFGHSPAYGGHLDSDYGYDPVAYPARPADAPAHSGAWRAGEDTRAVYDPQDWGRKFLRSNGACSYIDMTHLEIATPEYSSAKNFVAGSRAMLQVVRDAMHAVNAELPDGERLFVTVNNRDGLGSSWGSHLNFLISRELWSRLFDKMLPDLFILAAFQASSIVINGQGKAGSDNRQPHADFQISQRADFIEKLSGSQTTAERPLVNSRDEPHCGVQLPSSLARLHCVSFDQCLSEMASLLSVGTMQLQLSLLEANHGDPLLMLADPVEALHLWSRDPDLVARAPLADGRMVTAVELQRAFLQKARWFARSVGYGEYVPHAELILDLWDETLSWLEARRFDLLRRRLDWVLKRELLQRAIDAHPDLDWHSPKIKHLDLLYSSLDEDEGLFWACERGGLTERVVTDAQIERFMHQPPEDTRAWGRAMLLRAVSPEQVEDVNWDRVTVRVGDDRDGSPIRRTFELADPTRFTRAELQGVFDSGCSLADLLDRFDRAIRIGDRETRNPGS